MAGPTGCHISWRLHSCTAHLSLPAPGVCQDLLPVDCRDRCLAALPLLLNLLLLPGLPPAADGVSGAAGAAGAAGCGGSGSAENLARAAAAAARTAAILSYLASSSTCRPCTPIVNRCHEPTLRYLMPEPCRQVDTAFYHALRNSIYSVAAECAF
jgi:hypothetical protein